VQLRQNNRLRPNDLVRKGDSAWVTAISVIGLFPQAPREQESGEQEPGEQESGETQGSVAEPTASSDVAGPDVPETHGSTVGQLDEPELKSNGSAVSRGISNGSRLGNYEILETIGQGGMGVVLKARHIRMERLVALKVLKSKAVQSPTAVHRFHQEVRAAAKLAHSNIVTAYDADEVDGVHFLVMEYVNGHSLAELLASRGRLDVTESLGYAIQVARGLEYAHSEGVVHRDIKPGNLLLDKRGTVKILDMGLASIKKTAEANAEEPQQRGGEFVTQENQLLGTFDYMAPEQAEDAHSVDHRADIYSLGCTLYRLITGRLPYAGDTAIKKILAHRESPIPSILKMRPDAPGDVDLVIKKMLAKSPADRQASMTEVIADLAACLEGKARSSRMVEEETLDDTFRLAGEPGSSQSSGSSILRASDADVFIPIPEDDEDLKGPNRGKFDMVKPVDNDRFYWQVMGQQTGPFTLEQLRLRKIPPDDLVRSVYSTQWNRADEIEGLF
jgi:serine/threonine protein kinase